MRRRDFTSWNNPPRRGSVTLYFVFFLLITVPAMLVAIDLWRIAEGKVQQQRFCDAVAHATAIELTRETAGYSPLLYGDPTEIMTLCQTDGIAMAHYYADRNFVDGVALDLDTSTVNKDVEWGSFDFNAATPTFTEIDPTTASTADRRSINAVRIEGFRTAKRKNAIRLFGHAVSQMVTRTTAALDRRVVGFRQNDNAAVLPVVQTKLAYQNIPMVPVALLNDGTAESWATLVEAPTLSSMASKLPYGTMTVKIPTSSTADPVKNSQLLTIGTANLTEFNDQILNGVTAAQMAIYNPAASTMILDPSKAFTVNVLQFAAPAYDATMQTKFEKLRDNGTERVWPLYEVVEAVMGSNYVKVTGFVAARVTAVAPATDDDGFSYISLTLQPTLIETPTAFTDYSNRFLKTTTNPLITNSGPPSPYAGYTRLVNPYICRVRLVD